EACRRAVVKDIDRKAIETDDLGKAINHTGNVVESVTEFFSWWHVGLTKSRKVWHHDMKSVGEERDQIAEHVACAGEAVQQQQLRRLRRSRFAIENPGTIDISHAVLDGRHLSLLSL